MESNKINNDSNKNNNDNNNNKNVVKVSSPYTTWTVNMNGCH